MHSHPAPTPDKLGTVHFENSCALAVRASFDRAVALLHSFAYEVAAKEFEAVGQKDPSCAMAHWGVAMSQFHQLWSPPDAEELKLGHDQLLEAQKIGAKTAQEREFIAAAATFFSDTDPTHHASRDKQYEKAMQSVAEHFPKDDEVQMFYALSLLSTASPTDQTHANQKHAAAILEPIYARQPNHPGAAHYLIHAYDSTELAQKGLPAARAYSKIAPAAPHALHMPSHIFTRLGLWDDSIVSNDAARRVAKEQGDIGEELHAMDYLTYAYLQLGRDADAEQVVGMLSSMKSGLTSDFKVSYAVTAMPVRMAVERGRWADLLSLEPIINSPPHVAAIVYWARALGHARAKQIDAAQKDIAQIDACEQQANARVNAYWAMQVAVLSKEARAWVANASGHADEAITLMRAAADAEDALEKLPVTPGPIVPAREQLGQLLLEMHQPKQALDALNQALKDAPGRRNALAMAARAKQEAAGSGSTD